MPQPQRVHDRGASRVLAPAGQAGLGDAEVPPRLDDAGMRHAALEAIAPAFELAALREQGLCRIAGRVAQRRATQEVTGSEQAALVEGRDAEGR